MNSWEKWDHCKWLIDTSITQKDGCVVVSFSGDEVVAGINDVCFSFGVVFLIGSWVVVMVSWVWCMALYLDVVENFLVTPRTGVGVAFNKGILIDYTQLGNKCHAFFSHLFVRSTADQNLCISMERVLLTTRRQKKCITLIPQQGLYWS